MAVPLKALGGVNKTAAKVSGAVTDKAKVYLEKMDIQWKNQFEVFFIPTLSSTSAFSSALSVTSAALSTVLTKFHVQTMDVNLFSIEYEAMNSEKIATHLVFPEEFTMTFIENDVGAVREFFAKWTRDVVVRKTDKLFGGSGASGYFFGQKNYLFRDEQDVSKKTAVIIPQMNTGMPSDGWIRLDGVRYKSLGNMTFGHAESDPLLLEVVFTCDNAWFMTIGGAASDLF